MNSKLLKTFLIIIPIITGIVTTKNIFNDIPSIETSFSTYVILNKSIDKDIGKNIGAILQTDQAEADLKVAEAKAEERRAMAVAAEQEMIAKAQDARAKVILAEAEVPKAMAEAFKKGNLGILDYYKFQNIQADTEMRESIADNEPKTTGKPDKGKSKD